MTHNEAATEYREAYLAGRDESARTDSDPKQAQCPYEEGTPERTAWQWGWNIHYDDAWDLE